MGLLYVAGVKVEGFDTGVTEALGGVLVMVECNVFDVFKVAFLANTLLVEVAVGL